MPHKRDIIIYKHFIIIKFYAINPNIQPAKVDKTTTSIT